MDEIKELTLINHTSKNPNKDIDTLKENTIRTILNTGIDTDFNSSHAYPYIRIAQISKSLKDKYSNKNNALAD